MNDQRYRPAPPSADAPGKVQAFPVVGIGASAGGLRAFERLFDAMPERPGMAFVIVQHLDPTHESSLAELLQQHTAMPVRQVADHTAVEPGCVYVIPPGKQLTIREGKLRLAEPAHPRGQRAPIDAFFRSLAEDQGERAACIILSGTGSDGSVGLKSIKESGGVVFVQEPGDADHDGMPKSALATGQADVSAAADELARKLIEYHMSADRIQLPGGDGELPAQESSALQKILTQLKSQTNHDFSRYKRSTILRRLQRRMQVQQIEDMTSYLARLRGNEQEAQALLKDFLISVTNFFRDTEAFEALEREAIPGLFDGKRDDDQVRVWVPGCATGEEAYSIAMLLCEQCDTVLAPPRIQVFASDIDDDAVAFARRALYPEVIAADVSAERLTRFFRAEDSGYRVKHPVQEVVLFAQHNLLRDPPFSKLDLISCRNLLIYLERDVQQDVFRLFHYALGEGGFLFLGSSETAEGARDFFVAVDKKHRLYRRKDGPARLVLPPTVSASTDAAHAQPSEGAPPRRFALGEVHRELMLEAYAPPSVIVDEHHEICYLFGAVGRYLRPSEGEPTHDLLRMVPRELRVELRTALFQALRKGLPAPPRRLRIVVDDQQQIVNLIVRPVAREDLDGPLALVVFEPVEEPEANGQASEAPRYDDELVEHLEDELQRTHHRLETVIEEYETSNEELKASNEELQSMNEELRSTTEELETSKEELQSTNEELETVNHELKAKVDELNRANSDLENLMASTHIGTLFLDSDLHVKRYTPAATHLFNIIPADIGRPFAHISHKIDHDDLPGLAARVLERLETIEEEIKGREGGHFLMRMMPYRTLENKIDGVVATFVEITERKKAQEKERERSRHQAVIAELRQRALQGTDPTELMDLTVRQVAQTLDVPYCKVLELHPGDDNLVLRAGVGWREGYVGEARVGTDRDSQAGYTLREGGPVIVEELAQEKRFKGPSLLTEHGVVSGLSVVVQGAAQPYGVMGVHTRHHRAFSEQEAHFVQSVANVLGAAIERHRAVEALRESEERTRLATEATGLVTWAWEPRTGRISTSGNLAEIYGLPELAGVDEGFALVLAEDRKQHLGKVERIASEGGEYVSEFRIRRPEDGRIVWLEERARAFADEAGQVERVVGVTFDVTGRKQAQAALLESRAQLAALNEELETRVHARTRQVRSLASSLTLAEQRERHRVAQILHDDLQQLLYAAQVQLRMAERAMDEVGQAAAERLAAVDEILSRAFQVARTLTVDLSPPVLKDEGLPEALRWLGAQMEEIHGLTVHVQAAEPVPVKKEEMRVLLFQLVRELLFNVVKHAGVAQARVLLRRQDDLIHIRVEDDGSGFDPEAVTRDEHWATGFGLYRVQERLGLFGGQLELESAPGKGTRATITVPGDPPDHAA